MISLRLPPDTESLVSQLALRESISRSEWIRRLIDRQVEQQAVLDPHAQYLKLTAQLPAIAKNSRSSTNAAGHSAILRGNPRLDRRGAKQP